MYMVPLIASKQKEDAEHRAKEYLLVLAVAYLNDNQGRLQSRCVEIGGCGCRAPHIHHTLL